MAVKRKIGENLTDDNIEKVISLLEGEKPITKKAACEMLSIAYNTTRLNNIITEYNETQLYRKARRKALRYTKVTDAEAKLIVQSYLSCESLAAISDETFRSTAVIKRVLSQYNIPMRSTSNNYFNPLFLEDDTWKDEYEPGDLVYSARYNSPATVVKLVQIHDTHGNVYRIEFHGENRFFAGQPAYELADLTQVQKQFGIVLEDLSSDEVKRLLYETYLKSKKMDKK